MPSPFPGMDPFLENQEWEDLHTTFNTVVREQLAPILRPRYLIRVERRVYLEHPGTEPDTMRIADVAIVARDPSITTAPTVSDSTPMIPAACTLPMPAERRETYLVIREHVSMEVITVIELLSPANKRSGGDGRREYMSKREQILSSPTHLVEIDLLRGGRRLPIREELPAADYFCIVSRAWQRPRAELYSWTVQQPLPTIAIPLKQADGDVSLHLQHVLDTVYERAGYDLSVNYQADLDPPADDTTQEWIRSQIERDT